MRLFLPILSTIGGDTTHYLERTAKVQWGLMICVFCISHVPLLLNLHVPGYDPARNVLLFAFLVIVVQSSDVLQYIWQAGKHLIVPKPSPRRRWRARRWRAECQRAGRSAVVDHPVHAAAGVRPVAADQPDGVLGFDVGDQA